MNTWYQVVDGRICTYGLEYFAVDHCNLRCIGCAQSSPFVPVAFGNLGQLERDLSVLRKHLRPKKFTILGGEPLLHPEIDKIARIARASGMFERICVTTNGLRLSSMNDAFWSSVDSVRVSTYPATSARLKAIWPDLLEKSAAFGVNLEERAMPEFNTIVHPTGHATSEESDASFSKCIYKHYCHNVRSGMLFRCSPVIHLDALFARMKRPERVSDVDALHIEDTAEFREKILSFFLNRLPLEGCRYCFGSSGAKFPHRMMTKKESDEPQGLFS